jgi:hypothetical protein
VNSVYKYLYTHTHTHSHTTESDERRLPGAASEGDRARPQVPLHLHATRGHALGANAGEEDKVSVGCVCDMCGVWCWVCWVWFVVFGGCGVVLHGVACVGRIVWCIRIVYLWVYISTFINHINTAPTSYHTTHYTTTLPTPQLIHGDRGAFSRGELPYGD